MFWFYCTIITVLILYAMSFLIPKEDRKSKAFGTAKFGSGQFKKKKKGFTIDGTQRLSLDDSYRHLLLIAGSGGGGKKIGGKTTTFIIPSIINFALEKNRKYQSSLIITDVKGDLHPMLSGFLASKGYEIKVLDFINVKHSDFYNPFHFLNSDQDFKNLALSIFDLSNGGKATEGIWRFGASNIIYWLLSLLNAIDRKYLNSANLLYLIHRVEKHNSEVIRLMESYLSDTPIIVQFNSFLNSDVKIRSSQLMSAITAVTFFDSDELRTITHKNTIEFSELRTRKTALFLKVRPGASSVYSLLTLFYSQLFDYCLNTTLDKSHYPLMVLGDEFGNLAKIGGDKFFSQVLTLIRSQAVALSLVVQSISQIVDVYNPIQAKTILSGVATVVAYPGVRGQENISFLQSLLGQSTYQYYDNNLNQTQMVKRALLTESEIREMKLGIAIPSSAQPERLKLKPIYLNKRLLRRAKLKSKDGRLIPKLLPVSRTNQTSIIPYVSELLQNQDHQSEQAEIESFQERLDKLLPKK